MQGDWTRAPVHDVTIVGGGIVGLSTARAVIERSPSARVLVLEKERTTAVHQTGHNSGVIHSGLYYAPGSLKARFCRDGNQSMVAFCERHGIRYERCGKVVVAADSSELAGLDRLHQRGLANGLEVERIGPDEVRSLEPHVACVGGIRVPSTGIVDYGDVCRTFAEGLAEAGSEIRCGTEALAITHRQNHLVVETTAGDFTTGFLVNCGGLQSDRVAKLDGQPPPARIVPFRGEYYELVPGRRHLIRNLVYPVPNPEFPFLGVHFTRMMDGSVHAGPNAVPALKREGYRKRDISLRDTAGTLGYGGFWRLAAKHSREGLKEVVRSFSKAAFVKSLQRLVPEVTADDIVPAGAGVRAQALLPSGVLVDDFLIVEGDRSVHVCNAPSPAATASLEIGRAVAARLPPDLGRA